MQQPPSFESFKSIKSPCVDKVPSHWETKANRYLFKEMKTTVGKNAKDYTLLSLTLNGVIPRDMENPQGKFPAEFNTYKVVKPNDLIFCLFDVEETPRAVGHSKHNGMITGAYTVLECLDGTNSEFLYYYYLALDFNKKLKYYYTGLRNVISRDAFMGMISPIPPIHEQKRIVSFLDKKTAEIDEAIARKKKLIELLQEQKSILINQAVTKGLNPDAPMKDSGVEWIGEIPEHWDVRRLKYLFREIDQRSKNGEEPLLSLRMREGLVFHNDVSDKQIEPNDIIGYKVIHPGQIVMNRMRAVTGLFAVATVEGCVSPDYAIFEPIEEVDESYYTLVFKWSDIKDVFWLEAKGLGTGESGFLRLYSDGFGRVFSPLPPLDEQQEIVDFISAKTHKYDDAVLKTEDQIKNLIEFKQSVISSAVTGKIKV